MKILITGDFCPRDRVADKFLQKQYSYVLNDVHEVVKLHDYSIVNEECPIMINTARPITKFCSNLSFSHEGFEALKYAGFNCLTLANNHFKDFGEEGVRQTLSTAISMGFDTVGGGMCLKDAQKVLYKKIGTINIAIVNFCEHEFSVASPSTAGSAPLDIPSNFYQIRDARKNADFVIVIVHGGHEHYQLPSIRMKKTYRMFIDWGADVVVNHHQHCFSGYDTYNGKHIFYGLGNLCFDSPARNTIWNNGVMLSMTINEHLDYYFELIPYKQCSENPNVEILHGNEKEVVLKRIEELNYEIEDDNKLQDAFELYCRRRQQEMMLAISPYSNRLLKGLCRRRFLPSFNNIKRIVKLRNFVQCESHRDVINQYLDQCYFDYENKHQ